MSGRRSDYRYDVMNTEGTLRVLRDVTVQHGNGEQFIAITDEPTSSGELLTLEHVENGEQLATQVCVIDSRLVVVSGSLRYRLVLKPTGNPDSGRTRHRRKTSSRSR